MISKLEGFNVKMPFRLRPTLDACGVINDVRGDPCSGSRATLLAEVWSIDAFHRFLPEKYWSIDSLTMSRMIVNAHARICEVPHKIMLKVTNATIPMELCELHRCVQIPGINDADNRLCNRLNSVLIDLNTGERFNDVFDSRLRKPWYRDTIFGNQLSSLDAKAYTDWMRTIYFSKWCDCKRKWKNEPDDESSIGDISLLYDSFFPAPSSKPASWPRSSIDYPEGIIGDYAFQVIKAAQLEPPIIRDTVGTSVIRSFLDPSKTHLRDDADTESLVDATEQVKAMLIDDLAIEVQACLGYHYEDGYPGWPSAKDVVKFHARDVITVRQAGPIPLQGIRTQYTYQRWPIDNLEPANASRLLK